MIETLRALSFDLWQRMATAEVTAEFMSVMVGQINKLALTTQRLERLASESVCRERQVREEESLRTAGEIAKKAAEEAGTGGSVSVERLHQIARDVYGVWVEKPEARKGLSVETATEIRREILGIPDRQFPPPAN